MRALFAVFLSVFALPADAALAYRFTTKFVADQPRTGGGRAWVDGDRYRIELDPDPSNPRPFDVTIFANGKTTFLNLQNQTWYHEQKIPAGGRGSGSSTLFILPTWGEQKIKGKPKIAIRSEGAGASLGDYATVKHVLEIRYRLVTSIQGTSLQGDVTATLSLVAAPQLPRIGAEPLLQTMLPEIDAEVAKLLAPIEGMVAGKDLTVSRRLEGGPVVTERMTTIVDEVKTVDRIDGSLFAVPKGFQFQEPLIGVPGM